jgi:hypothetical protein
MDTNSRHDTRLRQNGKVPLAEHIRHLFKGQTKFTNPAIRTRSLARTLWPRLWPFCLRDP